jgi:predicted Ser/Thr protein kinase
MLALQVEVSPSSFQKVKLLGKGDVGKVYLVREKKTDKLFAMKGKLPSTAFRLPSYRSSAS